MAARTISAKYSGSNQIIQNYYGVSFDSSLSFGAAVSNSYVTSGTIQITNFRAMYTGSMYLDIYIGSSLACRSQSFTFGENLATLSVSIDTSSGLNSSLLLTSSAANIVVYVGASGAGSSDFVAGLSGGSTITITANHAISTTAVGAPSGVKLSSSLSREAVTLSWNAGSAGTNNSVTGYDVQYRDSADANNWGGWTTVSNSPVSGRSISVNPPDTAGYYRQFRVRTRGSAGSSYYSAYVTSTNMLRRKWDAFGAWTDEELTPLVSSIRSVYIAELQERANVIREFYGLQAYAFTPVQAGVAKIAKWADLVQEIRDAIDGIAAAQSWNTLEAGKPRIAHITQLRSVIDSM